MKQAEHQHDWVARVTMIAVWLMAACSGPTGVQIGREARDTVVTVPLGGMLVVTLGTTGPGSYRSPPEIAGAAVVFVRADRIEPFTPGGTRQQFQFRAVHQGTAHIVVARGVVGGMIDTTAFVFDVSVP